MKKISRFLLFIIAAIAIILINTGCSTTMTSEQGSNIFTVTATAVTNNEANAYALTKASHVCDQQDTDVKILDLDTQYQGIDRQQQALAKLANSVLPGSKSSPPFFPADRTYKTTLTFKCE